MREVRARGGCLCGGVRYEVTGPLRGVWACHCSQCRRTSGNFVAATQCRRDDLDLLSTETLAWYRSSPAPSVASAPAAAATCSGGLTGAT